MWSEVKVGDLVTRMFGGVPALELTVTEVADDLIHCGPWTFRKDNGGEVDEDLGWDGVTRTGSVLVPRDPEQC
jgi:hypothetical protein